MSLLRGFGTPPPEDDDGETLFAIHHMIPGRYGGTDVGEMIHTELPSIDLDRARQPISPGMPPLWHVPLPKPEFYRPAAPPGVSTAPALPIRPLVTPSDRVTFPIPETPSFQRLKPAPAIAPSAEEKALEPVAMPAPQQVSTTAAQPVHIALSVEEARTSPSVFEKVNPFYALAIYIAFALGTLFIDISLESRYTFLWTLLIVIGGALSMMDSRRERRGITSSGTVWGFGIGFMIGLPLLILTTRGLSQASKGLFPYATLPGLFQTLVFLGPLGETVFFRGLLQERRGFIASVIGAGIATVMLYWPAGGSAVLIAIFLSMTAAVYSYVRERYGLGAAYACQVTLNLMLFFVPRMLVAPRP